MTSDPPVGYPNGNKRQIPNALAHCMTLVALSVYMMSSGCRLSWNDWDGESIPARRLDPNLFSCSLDDHTPVPMTSLGQPLPHEHRIAAGDVLSVYIYGIFPPGVEETPIINQQQGTNQRYYPPHGSVVSPATGLPLPVQEGGIIDLPMIKPFGIGGLTLSQATDAIRTAYHEHEVLLEGQGRITVSLLIPRTSRIVVMREDSPSTQVTMSSSNAVEQVHRGSGQVVDLPIYENDVLHALSATGGMPGTDGAREIYVIRNSGDLTDDILNASEPQSIIDEQMRQVDENVRIQASPIIRIPLTLASCEGTSFDPEDVILNDGDVVYVPRRHEYFYTGGLLGGGRVPLPRDEDLDIVEALSMAGASPGGPMGKDGTALATGRHTYLRAATRAVILRRLPDGRQLNIRVDLDRAMHDPKERIRIQPDDVVMLYQKPIAATVNAVLNLGGR